MARGEAEETFEPRPEVRISEVGEFIRHQSCQRRFKLDSNHRRLTRRLPFAERLFNPLDYVLSARGKELETRWEQDLSKNGFMEIVTRVPDVEDDNRYPSWDDFINGLSALKVGECAYGREVRLGGRIEAFDLTGRADFILLYWRDNLPVLRVVECKASRRDRTYQRLQVAFYSIIVKDLLGANPVTIDGHVLSPQQVESVVARIDEESNERQNILDLAALDLTLEEADALRLVSPDGTLAAIVRTDLDDLGYQLDSKCDGCVFSVDCLPESARQRRHELLGISPSIATALRSAGIDSIDDLADIDVQDARARAVRSDPGFTETIERLRALASARRATLPSGGNDPEEYPVQAIRPAPTSQLPLHAQNGTRLVRVYLSVDYDYTENRIGALSAHITNSDALLHTAWSDDAERRQPDPEIVERQPLTGPDGRRTGWHEPRPVQGADVQAFQTSAWSGEYLSDTGSERQILQSFLHDLIEAISEFAVAGNVKLHFYVWSRNEMTRLVEACSRTSGKLLSALRELLGCRESLEQLIYSCVQDEINQRYALGWTGRGLSVVSSLPWFGRRYHWRRRVAGRDVDLDQLFTQDIFDFKTTLGLKSDGSWSKNSKEEVSKHRFEIRSRFHDSLPAPYWHAVWDTLPDPNSTSIQMPANTRNAILRYRQAGEPGILRAYLKARVHALRWLEESVTFKNEDIEKPTIRVSDIRRFTLNINNVATAGIDFLRLDHFVKLTDWTAANIQPPAGRVPRGRTLPLRNVRAIGRGRLLADIDLSGYDLDLETLRVRSPFDVGSFCRISPCSDDPHRGQSIRQLRAGGRTATIARIDWTTGEVELDEIFSNETRYILHSGASNASGPVFDFATLDESPSDFVAGRVERRLSGGLGAHVYPWFDPEHPQVPEQNEIDDDLRTLVTRVIESIEFGSGFRVSEDQQRAISEGLDARVQVLQGPPGTGKTQTTSVAIALRAAVHVGSGGIVLVAAHTHTAVDTLLRRISAIIPAVNSASHAAGLAMPTLGIGKIHSNEVPPGGSGIAGILDIRAGSAVRKIDSLTRNGVAVLGGTTSAILKLAEKLDSSAKWRNRGGFAAETLVVDEGSMMVLPHFLALATLVRENGDILVAGDHRQLEPIVAHDWEHEDRPPAVVYQPFSSAFNAIRGIGAREDVTERSVRRSALELTFRLPPLITEVIARLYKLDEIDLRTFKEQSDQNVEVANDASEHGLDRVWQGDTGLFLVLHDERNSRQSNELEAALIEAILNSNDQLQTDSVAVITPHRAQRSLLTARIHHEAVGVIDTVERLQGGERPTIIVSGTASDPAAIAANASFLLDLNRSNVAFSRAQERLIVVCARSLLDALPAELEDYHSALLWKSLRGLCTRQIGRGQMSESNFAVYTVPSRLEH